MIRWIKHICIKCTVWYCDKSRVTCDIFYYSRGNWPYDGSWCTNFYNALCADFKFGSAYEFKNTSVCDFMKEMGFFVSEMEFGWESLQIHNVATKTVQSVFLLYAEHHKKTEKHICSVNSVFLQIWFIYNSEFIQQSSYCSRKKKCIHILPKNISWFLKSFKIIRNHKALESAW